MRLRAIAVVLVLAAAIGSASAQQQQTTMLTSPDTSGCQIYAPYIWVELAPGQKWTATVDLSNCSASDLGGWFRYYGHLGTNSSCNTLKIKDGVVLTAVNLRTQDQFLPATTGGPKDEEYVLLRVDAPAQYQLTAQNTSHQTVKVRMTWVSMAKQ